jgi:hypothetical protein
VITSGLDDQPVVVAVRGAQPGVDVGQGHGAALRLPREGQADALRVASAAVVLDAQQALRPGVLRDDAHGDPAAVPVEAVLDGVLHERLQAQVGDGDRQHLGRDAERHLQAFAEPRPLQQQVAVDRAQLLGQRRELPVGAVGIAGELGEVEQQLAGTVRVGPDERSDGRERVVDEVRADLSAQSGELCLRQPGPRGIELGQLQLTGDPAGDLLDGTYEAGRDLRGERHQCAHHGVFHDKGGSHGPADGAGLVGAGQVVHQARPTGRQHVGCEDG